MKNLLAAMFFAFAAPAARAEMYGVSAAAECPNGDLEAMWQASTQAFTPRPDRARVRFSGVGWQTHQAFAYSAFLEARTEADLPYLRAYVAEHPGFVFENLNARVEKVEKMLSVQRLTISFAPGTREDRVFERIAEYPTLRELVDVCDRVETVFSESKRDLAKVYALVDDLLGPLNAATFKYFLGKYTAERLEFAATSFSFQFASGRVATADMSCEPSWMELAKPATERHGGKLRFPEATPPQKVRHHFVD